MVDISIKYYTGYFRKNNFSVADNGRQKCWDTCNKIEFLSILVTFPPFSPKQCWFFYFLDCTDHSAYTTLNWGAGGIRELTPEANKIEQMLKYRKASFPKSVSTAFVAHCRFITLNVTGYKIYLWEHDGRLLRRREWHFNCYQDE